MQRGGEMAGALVEFAVVGVDGFVAVAADNGDIAMCGGAMLQDAGQQERQILMQSLHGSTYSSVGGIVRPGIGSGKRGNVVAGMMDGKVAVVTGAGGGVGREIAIMMAAAGAKVIVADIGASLSGEGGSASPAEQTKALIEQKGGAAQICTESVAAWGSAQKIIQAAMDHFGRIDAVVNNAGILRDGIFHRMTEDDWLSVINVHLNGSFFVSRAAAEHYRKQESGTFVHMSSTSGLIGNFGQANYAAAKLGMTALSKSIALDMQRYNVRSN